MTQGYEQTDNSDPGSQGLAGDGSSEQLTQQDTLDDRGVADLLDEGYSPPDREPAVRVPTESEEAEGESLDERLAQEEPEVADDGDDEANDVEGVGTERAGRLVDEESNGYDDVEKDLVAGDVGIDGAGASAEEAAVHVIEGEPDEENSHPDGEIDL